MNVRREDIYNILHSLGIILNNTQLEKLMSRIESQRKLIELIEKVNLDYNVESFALIPVWVKRPDQFNLSEENIEIQYEKKSSLFGNFPYGNSTRDILRPGIFFEDIFSSSIERGSLSPVDAVKKSIKKIRESKGSKVFIRVFEDRALREAESLEKSYIGDQKQDQNLPLFGTTAGIKDIIAVEGHRMTAGSKVLDLPPSEEDAAVIKNLRRAGAVVVGVTNLHELAFGTTNINPHYGTVRNPINSKYIAGGSSGGSAAAVKIGMVDFAIGTDTGGSVRIPASCCGIVGFKPSYGMLSVSGVFPLGYTLDHVGVLARSVWEAGVVTESMLDRYGYFTSPMKAYVQKRFKKEISPISKNSSKWKDKDAEGIQLNRSVLDDFRIGIPNHFFLEETQQEVKEGFNSAIEKLKCYGAEIVGIDLPYHRYSVACYLCTSGPEALGIHFNRLTQKQDLFGEDVLLRLASVIFIPAYARVKAQRIRNLMFCELHNELKKVDIVATPTLAVTVPLIDDRFVEINGKKIDVISALLRNTAPFDLTGTPAITLPCGKDRNGMPIGLQLACGYGEDVKLLCISILVENILKS